MLEVLFHRSEEDFLRAVTRQGPIKPFQGNETHRTFLELILAYELKPLPKEERANCADAHCACGKTHDPDAFDKQFRRLKKELQRSFDLER